MNFLDKLERKFGKYAIPNLILYILLGQVVFFFFYYVCVFTQRSANFINYLYFDIHAILKGQIWRLITCLFLPTSLGPLNFAISIILYYTIARALETNWGTFRFNLYYLSGVLFNMMGASVIQFFFPNVYVSITNYLNMSLFLAFAVLFSDLEFLLFFIIPVKAKYLALFDGFLLLIDFMTGDLSIKVLIILSLLNFFLFFASYLRRGHRTTRTQRQFNTKKKQGVSTLKQGPPIKVAFHKCSVCGKTELTDPDMEFRYCSKCNGDYEYCMEHLYNHEHKK